jgi:Alpha/beta hydrolase domain
MLWQGFHVDESGRPVFDGAMPHVSGAGKGSFNHRFAQTTRHPSHLQDHQYPADVFPFTTTPQTDPVTGASGDVLARARQLGHVPKVLYTGTATEYWSRAASLLHTDAAGARDWPLDERVRLYFFAGAQHQISSSIDPGSFGYTRNVLDHAPPLRALLVALDRWVTEDAPPPPSVYPRIDRGELITASDYAERFPHLPGVTAPADCLMPPRLDLGPRFATEGIIDVHPPGLGPAYGSRVPAPDADGNDLGGLRLPDVAVALGTYVGWNRRGEEMGATDFLARWAGSFFPFAATRAERVSRGDPRPSLEERYASAEEYLSLLEQAASRLVEQGYLLEEDAAAIVQRARNRGWPPSFE